MADRDRSHFEFNNDLFKIPEWESLKVFKLGEWLLPFGRFLEMVST